MGKIYSNNDLRRRLKIEPKLVGFTSAGHKVEFAFYHLGRNGRLDLDRLFGSRVLEGWRGCNKSPTY